MIGQHQLTLTTVRENELDSNENQIKHIFIEDPGVGYSGGEVPIVGDGTGARAVITVDSLVNNRCYCLIWWKGYTHAMVDLGPLQPVGSIPNPAKLIPIIPPSKGHGHLVKN